jgi:lipopolysaccharide heptosyltransferase II
MSLNIEKVKNVLVLAPDKHIGDLVLSLSAINALREFFRDRNFYLVIDSAYAEIIETMDGLDNLILYPRRELKKAYFIKRFGILLKFLRQLRRTSPDIAIDLQGGVASSTLTLLSDSPIRVGRSTAKRAFSYNLKVDLLKGGHKVRSYMEIASALGVKSRIDVCRIKASERRRAGLRDALFKHGITDKKPVVCVHPGAGVVYKQWTEEGFADVSDRLASEGFQVVFVGGKGDLEEIKKIRGKMKDRAYDLGGALSLGELIALFEISSLYIGNDSGPMHLADLTGVPIVALFGPAREERWGPISGKSVVLRGAEPCEKCRGKDCEYGFKCVKRISPDDVKAAVEKLIDRRGPVRTGISEGRYQK